MRKILRSSILGFAAAGTIGLGTAAQAQQAPLSGDHTPINSIAVRQADGKVSLHRRIGDLSNVIAREEIIPGQRFDWVEAYSLASDGQQMMVMTNGKVGLLGKDHRYIVPANYDWVEHCLAGYAQIFRGNRMGLWDCEARRELIAPTYVSVTAPEETKQAVGAVPASDSSIGFGIFGLDGVERHKSHHLVMSPGGPGVFLTWEQGSLFWFDADGSRIFAQQDGDDWLTRNTLVRKVNGRAGVFDRSLAALIPPQFDSIDCEDRVCEGRTRGQQPYTFDQLTLRKLPARDRSFNSLGLKIEETGSEARVVDRSGKVILSGIAPKGSLCENSCVTLAANGDIVARKRSGWGVVDRTGRQILPFLYRESYNLSGKKADNPFTSWDDDSHHFAQTVDGAKTGIFQVGKGWLIPPGTLGEVGAVPFKNNGQRISVEIKDASGRVGLYDATRSIWLVEPNYAWVSDNWAGATLSRGRGQPADYYAHGIDKLMRGTATHDFYRYDQHANMFEIKAPNGLKGVADVNGKVVLPPIYQSIEIAGSQGRILALREDKIGIFDLAGRQVAPAKWTCKDCGRGPDGEWKQPWLPFFEGQPGAVELMRGGMKVLVDRDGKELASAREFGGNVAKLGLLDSHIGGKMIVTAKYDQPGGEDYRYAIKVDGKIYHDATGDIGYQRDLTFENGLMAVRDGDRFGYIDHRGRMVIPARFTHAEQFRDGLALIELDGKWLYIDRAGNPTGAGHFGFAVSRNSVKKW